MGPIMQLLYYLYDDIVGSLIMALGENTMQFEM